jgi:hypothetical protein
MPEETTTAPAPAPTKPVTEWKPVEGQPGKKYLAKVTHPDGLILTTTEYSRSEATDRMKTGTWHLSRTDGTEYAIPVHFRSGKYSAGSRKAASLIAAVEAAIQASLDPSRVHAETVSAPETSGGTAAQRREMAELAAADAEAQETARRLAETEAAIEDVSANPVVPAKRTAKKASAAKKAPARN